MKNSQKIGHTHSYISSYQTGVIKTLLNIYNYTTSNFLNLKKNTSLTWNYQLYKVTQTAYLMKVKNAADNSKHRKNYLNWWTISLSPCRVLRPKFYFTLKISRLRTSWATDPTVTVAIQLRITALASTRARWLTSTRKPSVLDMFHWKLNALKNTNICFVHLRLSTLSRLTDTCVTLTTNNHEKCYLNSLICKH